MAKLCKCRLFIQHFALHSTCSDFLVITTFIVKIKVRHGSTNRHYEILGHPCEFSVTHCPILTVFDVPKFNLLFKTADDQCFGAKV